LECTHTDGIECQNCPYWKEDDCAEILNEEVIVLLKEQEELLKHEYWRGYNNGRADERGLQEGTIMQTFSPD
jgi:hypothetical protein